MLRFIEARRRQLSVSDFFEIRGRNAESRIRGAGVKQPRFQVLVLSALGSICRTCPAAANAATRVDDDAAA